MLLVICNIIVTIYVSPIYLMQREQVEGKVISQNESNYLVDFSKDAEQKDYYGNYNKVLVKRTECVELK